MSTTTVEVTSDPPSINVNGHEPDTRRASIGELQTRRSLHEAKNAHFWKLAFPSIRLLVLSFMFIFFGIIQSSRAYTVIGSVFGAFIFSVAGVAFWAGYQGIIEAYSSVRENFSDDSQSAASRTQADKILAALTDARVVDDRYVEYRIDVSAMGKTWFVWRRYSDFYRVFKQESQFARNFSKCFLPSKSWFGSPLSATFIEERKVQLNEYIQTLLSEHGTRRMDSAMAEFFGM